MAGRRSPQLPGVRIPGAPFMGVSGVAPSAAQVKAWTVRENALIVARRNGLPARRDGAVPGRGPIASEGLEPCRRARTAATST